MKKLRISKLFHWLYAILMLLPFGLLVFNFGGVLFSQGSFTPIGLEDFDGYLYAFLGDLGVGHIGLSQTIFDVFDYLFNQVFGFYTTGGEVAVGETVVTLTTYWTVISIYWLIFDVLMYIPNLFHSWLDRSVVE